MSRRLLIKAAAATAVLVAPLMRSHSSKAYEVETKADQTVLKTPLGTDANGKSYVHIARGGSPEENVSRVVDMLGGIDSVVGNRDIVVIKANSQWWNQGMTNTDAIKGFIDLVISRPGFEGEVIIADNHQYAQDNSRGWTTEDRNGRFNYNELVDHYRRKGVTVVTKAHWHVAGKTDLVLEGNAQGNNRIAGPQDGDGYVWLEDRFYSSPAGRICVMTYPVFTSSYSGITIDLKNGPWRNGEYLQDRKVRFINFSALNHHSFYCGVTASVKNLMGVVDMSCGFPGNAPEGTYNTHHIGVSRKIRWKRSNLIMRIASRLGLRETFFEYCYRNFHHTGGSLGYFMRHVRLPDLNIITAEYVGWGSRTDKDKAARTRAVAASCDPVALDYIAAREILLPVTPERKHHFGSTYRQLNDPENENGPLYRFLHEAAKQGIGNLDPDNIEVLESRSRQA